MKIDKLSIIIPAYNEANTIFLILNNIEAVELIDNIKKEIIIVDDCSTDNTQLTIAAYHSENPGLDIRYFKHEVNRGKWAAYCILKHGVLSK